jgi:tetratricopeptide (TPR) repeat protein
VRYFAERLGMEADELLTGRPAQLATDLGLRLAEARHDVSSGDLPTALDAYTDVLDTATAHGLPRLQARALEGLARCAERAGNVGDALKHLDEALARLEDEPITERVPALVAKARIQRNRGQIRETAYMLESALERLERESLLDPDTIVQLQYGLVAVYIDLGLPDRAARAGDAALCMAGQVADPEHVGRMYIQLCRTYMLQGRWRDAEDSLDRAHQTFRQLDYAVETAMCQWARGYLLLGEDRLPEAEIQLRTARDTMRALGSWYYAGTLASELATVLWRLGRNGEALDALEDAWRLESESRTLPLGVADAYRLRGMICLDTGDLAEAETSLERALAFFITAEAGPLAAKTARVLGDMLIDQGRIDDAVKTYQSGLTAAAERS